MRIRIALTLSLFFVFGLTPTTTRISAQTKTERPAVSAKATDSIRTELYFGRNITDGGFVSDTDWETFLSDVVTPKFSAGLTVIDAAGQFREPEGRIVCEPSKILILIYPKKMRKTFDASIESVRTAYIKTFHQTSVLRVDSRVKVY
jgi:hypothetical protein